MKGVKVLGLGVLSLTSSIGCAAQAAHFDNFSGQWRTDLSSIAFSKVPEVTLLSGGVYVCQSCAPTYSLNADGQIHPLACNPAVDEQRVEVISHRTIRISDRKAGRITHTSEISVSTDGQHRTVSWEDLHHRGSPSIAGETLQLRVGLAPAQAHETSGSWRSVSLLKTTDAARTESLLVKSDVITMTRATGESYRARIGGPVAPYRGDPSISAVRIHSVGPQTLVEEHLHRGRIISTLTMRLSSDGKTLFMEAKELRTGKMSSARVVKL